MTLPRKILIFAAVVLGLAVLLVLLALTSPVQTWAVRKVVASQADLKLEVERVSVGLKKVHVAKVRANYAGAILDLPELTADIAVVSAAWHGEVTVSKLIARGWTLDLTDYKPETVAAMGNGRTAPSGFSLISSAYAANAQPVAQTVFSGVLSQLELPVDLSLDGVVLDGTIIMRCGPDNAPTRMQVSLVGGGFSVGREGRFDLTSRLDLADAQASVSTIELQGNLSAVMDTPRTFVNLSGLLNAQATGQAFPQGVQLTTEITAARIKGGENYNLTVQSVGKRLIDVQANYPDNSSRVGGVWRLDLHDTDVAPFALGHVLPTFDAVGAGMFETDTGFAEVHAAGCIKSSANRLEALQPELKEIGELTLFTEFDLKQSGDSIRVNSLTVDANQASPVLTLRALQSFEINTSSGELKVADPSIDLMEANLIDVPMAWIAPFVDQVQLSGGRLRGQILASARDGGMTITTAKPLTITGLSVNSGADALLENLSVQAQMSANYAAQGWRANLTALEVSSGGTNLLSLQGHAKQPLGTDQPITAGGIVDLNLPAVLQQPGARQFAGLNGGRLQIEFSAMLAKEQDVKVSLHATGLIGPEGEALPMIGMVAQVRVSAEGIISFEVPMTFTQAASQRISDLNLKGTLQPDRDASQIKAVLSGKTVYLDDLELLSVMMVGSTTAAQPEVGITGRDAHPFWQGVTGQVDLALQSLYYTDQFEMKNVGGTIHIDESGLKLDGVNAELGEQSALNLQGSVGFDQSAPIPYRMVADMKVNDFASGPLLRALNPEVPPQLEGDFSFTTQLTSTGENALDLASRTQGDAQMTSKGGVFRLLPEKVSTQVENAGRIAAVGAFLGSVVGGGKDVRDFANKAQAVAELSMMLTAIKYDQLNLVVSRHEDLDTVLRDFTLISPEVRLAGEGLIKQQDGVGLLEQALSLNLQMKVRGKIGAAFKYLGLLDEQADDLGYAVCKLPLHVRGTLAQPDTSELQQALKNLALERSGANDFLNRILGN